MGKIGDDVQDICYDLVAQARVFHFGYPSLMDRLHAEGGRELASMIRRAKETGVTTSLDLTLPDLAGPSGRADWRTILAHTLPDVDLFLPSVEELIFMLRPERFKELTVRTGAADLLQAVTAAEIVSLARETLSMGAKIVLLKLGTSGTYLRTGTELSGLAVARQETCPRGTIANCGRLASSQMPPPRRWAPETPPLRDFWHQCGAAHHPAGR